MPIKNLTDSNAIEKSNGMAINKRVSRIDCVSNRNTIIMGNFTKGRLGSFAGIFDGLEYPKNASGRSFSSADDYYMWQHGWHTYEVYETAYRRVRDLFGSNTFAECGATVAKLQSWGLIGDTKYAVGGIREALRTVPVYNEAFNDMKDFVVMAPPLLNRKTKKISCTYILRFHDDLDPHKDYISDQHIQNILKQIPCVWGNNPADLFQPLLPYDLERLCELEPEFATLDLDPKVKNDVLYIRDPITQSKRTLARRVVFVEEDIDVIKKRIIEAYHSDGDRIKREDLLNRLEYLCGDPVLLGRYREWNPNERSDTIGFLLEGSLASEEHLYFPDKTILNAPYFLINLNCTKGGTFRSLWYPVKFKLEKERATKRSLVEALSQITHENKEKIKAYAKLEEYADRLEEMVEKRTRELRNTQKKLLEAEKKALEHRITGGFAHEMRNALTGAKFEFSSALNYQNTGNSSSEIIKESVTKLLENINRLQEEYGISKDTIISLFIPEIKTIAEQTDHLLDVHSGVLRGIERGLAITAQIRNYAKMSELKKGENLIDIVQLLNDYKNEYKNEFDKIEYTVTGISEAFVKADETHINSIFSNLILNAKDAINDSGKEGGSIVANILDDGDFFVVSIKDNGSGIPEDIMDEIFEPFYSTKPSTGTGLGLSVVKKMIELYGGAIQVESELSTGTTFFVSLPLGIEVAQ